MKATSKRSHRYLFAAVLGAFLVFVSPAFSANLTPLKDVRRIVFLGDSITQAGDYIADIDCWLLSQGVKVELLNFGLGSESATELTETENAAHKNSAGFPRPWIGERLDRILAATKPDLVFVCYGMNDAGALPMNDSALQRYAAALTHLRTTALASGAKNVVLLTPTVRETSADAWAANTHDQKLGRYAEWLLSKKSEGWSVVDVHGPMRQALDARRVQNPDFKFAKDNVHPGREGHWVIASCVLRQYFGADIDGLENAEQLFPAKGPEIRKLAAERLRTLFAAWMTQIGHTRPGVPGGPGVPPGPSVQQAEAKAAAIGEQIQHLLSASR